MKIIHPISNVVPIKDAQWQDLLRDMKNFVENQKKELAVVERKNRSLKRRNFNLKVANIDSSKKIDDF